tara:strand:+ start:813 stop:1148 length:336 start_codon:yes stop_codon:yes gene_type:complete
MQLDQRQCIKYTADTVSLTDSELDQLRLEVSDWQLQLRDGVKQLSKQFSFPDYVQTMAFTQRVGELAEAENHHPEILTKWGKVTVTWWTHAVNGLHINDFICAVKTDQRAE